MQPTNINNAHANKWLAVVKDHEALTFKIVGGIMPSVSSGITELGGGDNVSLTIPGDHVVFDDLSFDFLIDEDYSNYIELFNWLEANTRNNQADTRNLTIHLLDVHGNFRGIRVEFLHVWPISLTGWPFDNENVDSDIQSTVILKFERMQFIKNSVEVA